MFENERQTERVILVAVSTGSPEETEYSLKELEELAETAGVAVITSMSQNRTNPDPGTYLGRGKIEELRSMVIMFDATGVICDDELSPAQLNNLTEMLDCKVMDRTLLILDIFAARANTSEGKIQVELAQLKYRQARLVGLRRSLSRLGGGIGTRGPGEKKLEMDRRLIARRIGSLRRDLEEVKRHREVIRDGRKKGNLLTAAIVGYTNAGKSTLLNTLTDADVLAEDALFATLDPTTRVLELPGGEQILLTDTVGFISKLPHQLIDAFRSTLEETLYADMIIHVADLSNPHVEEQMAIVYETLRELGAENKTIITLFNKADKLSENPHLPDIHAKFTVTGSAKTGENLDALKQALEDVLLDQQVFITRKLPYDEAGKIAVVRQYGQLVSEDYQPDGIEIRAYIPKEIYGKYF